MDCQVLVVKSSTVKIATLVSSTGKVIRECQLSLGKNFLEIDDIASGVYLLSSENKKHRIVLTE